MTIIEHHLPSSPSNRTKQETTLELLRRLVFGTPIASDHVEQALVRKLIALPIFCSDAISSVAYGGQQILLALCLAGLWQPQYQSVYASYTMQILWAIFILLVIVSVSYRQTGLLLKLALLGKKDVVVANVRYWL